MLVRVIFFHHFGDLWSRIILQIHFGIVFFIQVSEIFFFFWKFLAFLFVFLFDDVSVCFFFFADAGGASAISQIIIIAFSFYLISSQNFILSKFRYLFIFTFFSFLLIYLFDYFWLLLLSILLILHNFVNLLLHFLFRHVPSFNLLFPILHIRFKTKVLISCHFILNFQKYVQLYKLCCKVDYGDVDQELYCKTDMENVPHWAFIRSDPSRQKLTSDLVKT